MRKFLLSSTSIVAAATIASYASADVSVTGGFDFKYTNISSNLSTSDGTRSWVVISFSNKTSGLTVGGRFDMDGDLHLEFNFNLRFQSIIIANDGVSDAGVTSRFNQWWPHL